VDKFKEIDFNFSWNTLKNFDPKIQREKAILSQRSKHIKTKFDEIYMSENLTEFDQVMRNVKPFYENINSNYNYFRKLIILVDMSEGLAIATDFKPNRQKFLFSKLESFIQNFFKNNYLSYISIITVKDYVAHVISPFSEDPAMLIQMLQAQNSLLGSISLNNGLSVGLFNFRNVKN
jgi:hypothetical protein